MSNNGNIYLSDVDELICKEKRYFVPDYQRGYRWRADREVRKLLEDIAGISDNTPYCLQPIVVKENNGEYEVVDGQQRLTTLYLICKCLGGDKIPLCHIRYKTRPSSANFLKNVDSFELNDEYKDNADYFFMYKAYKEINAHVNKEDNKLGEKLKNVNVIWYELPKDVNSIEIFDRLNSYRIPLNDAELIRALFLKKRSHDIDENRQFEMATEWDQMERELRDSSFWYFLTRNNPDDYDSRLELIFCIMTGEEKAKDHNVFNAFEKVIDKDPYGLWQRVCNCYTTLRSWYKDHELYHLIGYLVASGEKTMKDIVKEFIPEYLLVSTEKNKTQAELREMSKKFVKKSLMLGEDKSEISPRDKLEKLRYGSDNKIIERILLLFNVLYYKNSSGKTHRFPFDRYIIDKWSLEHIHPQKPESLHENMRDWWENKHERIYNKNLLNSYSPEQEKIICDLVTYLNSEKKRISHASNKKEEKYNTGSMITPDNAELLFNVIMNRSGEAHERHGLGNMALLQQSLNSSLQNHDFSLKCEQLLQEDAMGTYLPPCTRNAFLKYYTIMKPEPEKKEGNAYNMEIDMEFWTYDDRKYYMNGIINALNEYL